MINMLARRVYNFAASKKNKNLYEILKIPRTATPDEIKSSYYKLAKEHHPDAHHQKANVA